MGFTGNPPSKSGFGNLGQILLPAVIALVLATLVMFQYSPSKNSLSNVDDRVDVVLGRIAAVEGGLGEASGKLDTVVNTMGDYAKKDTLGGYATKDTLAGYATKTDLGGYVEKGNPEGYATQEDLDGLVTTAVLDAKISELEAKINDTGGGTDPTEPVVGGALVVDLPYQRYGWVYPGGVSSEQTLLYYTLRNISSQTIRNPRVKLTIHSQGTPIHFVFPDIEAQWPLQWTPIHFGNGFGVLQGVPFSWSGGLNIPAGGQVSGSLTLILKVEEEKVPSSNVALYPQIEVSYE